MTPEAFAERLGLIPPEVDRNLTRALMQGGHLLRTQIMANASGRPGPNAPTGDYRGSWAVTPVAGATLAVIVSTNRPQGPRLEYGFHGTDSLGRRYNQPAYAHVAPAIDRRTEAIRRVLERAVGDAL